MLTFTVNLNPIIKLTDEQFYRQGKTVEFIESATELSGEDVLPGFVLNLQFMWD